MHLFVCVCIYIYIYIQALDKPENVADFILWLLGDVSAEEFGGKEWDINDPEQQRRWLSTRR